MDGLETRICNEIRIRHKVFLLNNSKCLASGHHSDANEMYTTVFMSFLRLNVRNNYASYAI